MLDSAEACLKLTPPPGPGMYDLEFGVKFSPIHHSLASSDITPVSAAEQFATLLKGVVYPCIGIGYWIGSYQTVH